MKEKNKKVIVTSTAGEINPMYRQQWEDIIKCTSFDWIQKEEQRLVEELKNVRIRNVIPFDIVGEPSFSKVKMTIVPKQGKRIFNDVDPYGEEDWNE